MFILAGPFEPIPKWRLYRLIVETGEGDTRDL